MSRSGYLGALVDAGLLAPGDGYGKGVPLWREAGLRLVRRMVRAHVERIADFAPLVVEHPAFVAPETAGDVVPRDNMHWFRMPGTGTAYAVKADNMRASVELVRRGHRGVVVAVGGLTRTATGSTPPLFKDRHIWPAVQITHLVAARTAVETLDAHRVAVERLLASLCLPAVTVEVRDQPALLAYGDPCHLVVTCLPDGRPTVACTLYVMSRRHRQALGVEGALLDVGFTGKVLALAAMHHRDGRGLVLPSSVATLQVAVLTDPRTGSDRLERLGREFDAWGLRWRVDGPHPSRARRDRAERWLHRLGVPLLFGLDRRPGVETVTRRRPLDRRPVAEVCADLAARELAAADERLRRRAASRLVDGFNHAGRLAMVCPTCADRRTDVFGWVRPAGHGPCRDCGRRGRQALLSSTGRFY